MMPAATASLVDEMVAADDHLDTLLERRERSLESGMPGPSPASILAAEQRVAAARKALAAAQHRRRP